MPGVSVPYLNYFRAKPDIVYKTVHAVNGPLLVLKSIKKAKYGEMVKIRLKNGEVRRGQVLEMMGDTVVVQVLHGTFGIDVKDTSVEFSGDVMRCGVSEDILGRIFNGIGQPIDNGPSILPEDSVDINGYAMNPVMRECPQKMIQTGISAIDLLSSIARGQKIAIFSTSGLPHNDIAAQIVRQAAVYDDETKSSFAAIFVALGVSMEVGRFFKSELEDMGSMANISLFLNVALDPSIERILTPRISLSHAEFLAYECNRHVLVVITDMTEYANALREVSSAKEEIPGRCGYPSYMYTDLASLYERAGMVKGRKGSITQIPIMKVPHGDLRHPIPDLTGYITEGQIILDGNLHNRQIYPPINVLGSLSRLMKSAIGKEYTREDHPELASQIMYSVAMGEEAKESVRVMGKGGISEEEHYHLEFVKKFENTFLRQGYEENRNLSMTLDMAWDLLSIYPKDMLKRIPIELVNKYHRTKRRSTIESVKE